MENIGQEKDINEETVEQEQNIAKENPKIQKLAQKPYRKGLRTAGVVLFFIAAIFAIITVPFFWGVFSGDSSELGTALFSIFTLVIFGLWTMYPAIIAGVLSIIFLSFSVRASKSSLVMLILSSIIVIAELALFIFCLVNCSGN